MIHINIQKGLKIEGEQKTLSINTNITPGDFIVVYGKSGAGKTTFLRMLAGLTLPDKGNIIYNKQVWFDSATKQNKPIINRSIGFVFQDLALFPNMTVLQNLKYAAGKNQDHDYLHYLLQITELQKMRNRHPHSLSGGQKQRVAIIRALARKPKLLLLDEPFSFLDTAMQEQLKRELHKIHNRLNLTTLLVSHSPADIEGSADRYIEIKDGENKERNHRYNAASSQEAIVIDIQETNTFMLLHLLVNEKTIHLPIAKETQTQFSIGMKIEICVRNNAISINPIQP